MILSRLLKSLNGFGSKMNIEFCVLQQFLLSNKLESAMWLSRLFTVYCSIMFILPLLGLVFSPICWLPTSNKSPHPVFSYKSLLTCASCFSQTPGSCKFLPEGTLGQCFDQCSAPAPAVAPLSAESSVSGPGFAGR